MAAGHVEAAAAQYRSLVTKHADDWEILLSFFDISLSLGQGSISSLPVLHGLEQVSLQTEGGPQVCAWLVALHVGAGMVLLSFLTPCCTLVIKMVLLKMHCKSCIMEKVIKTLLAGKGASECRSHKLPCD